MPTYQVRDQCYPTQLAAAQAYVSSMLPQVVTTTSGCSFWSNYVAAGTESAPYVLVTYTKIPTTACAVVNPTTFNYLATPCGLIDWQDAKDLSWLVVGVWVAVYAIKRLVRAAQ
jgi:hypothetical protein